MSLILDGTSGLTTPGVVNTAGETIATTLAVTGASTLTGAVTASTTLAVTGVSTFAAGTALLPALTTTGDTNTGLWFPAADTVAASTGGTERMRIDSSGNLLFNSGYGSAATAYGCRAWVNFNGTGTPAIRASGNVSSITDVNTGRYYVNLTTAMPDTNYAVILGLPGGGPGVMDDTAGSGVINTSSQIFVGTSDQGSTDNAWADYALVCVAAFR